MRAGEPQEGQIRMIDASEAQESVVVSHLFHVKPQVKLEKSEKW